MRPSIQLCKRRRATPLTPAHGVPATSPTEASPAAGTPSTGTPMLDALRRRCEPQAHRLEDRVARTFVSGCLGRLVRRAVREHHYIFPPHAAASVTIGSGAILNDALLNVSSGTITIGSSVLLAHGVCILTGTHDYRQFGAYRRYAVPSGGRDVVIGDGVWIASNATVLGPCLIGEHAVVAAGSVVLTDVPAYAVVAGIPARVISMIRPA